MDATIPEGFCQCGCGGRTNIAEHRYQGIEKGQHFKYLKGHWAKHHWLKDEGQHYVVEDRGHDTPCWIWQLNKCRGYGRLTVAGVSTPAHRVYYERANGPIPAGLHLDHLCRVPACVRPSHLEPVTVAENRRRGVGLALNAEKADEIRRLYANGGARQGRKGGVTMQFLADTYGVSKSTISHIVRNERWAAT